LISKMDSIMELANSENSDEIFMTLIQKFGMPNREILYTGYIKWFLENQNIKDAIIDFESNESNHNSIYYIAFTDIRVLSYHEELTGINRRLWNFMKKYFPGWRISIVEMFTEVDDNIDKPVYFENKQSIYPSSLIDLLVDRCDSIIEGCQSKLDVSETEEFGYYCIVVEHI
jgi:hypothetical protein